MFFSLEIELLFHFELFLGSDQGTNLKALCHIGSGSEPLTTSNVTFAARAIASTLKDLAFKMNIRLPSSIVGNGVEIIGLIGSPISSLLLTKWNLWKCTFFSNDVEGPGRACAYGLGYICTSLRMVEIYKGLGRGRRS